LEEHSNGKGKLVDASEEGQSPHRAVEPMMMMMMNRFFIIFILHYKLSRFSKQPGKFVRILFP
jgi:hypothetical protein